MAVHRVERRRGGEEAGRGIDRDLEAELGEAGARQHRRLAALDHVDHQRLVERLPDARHLGLALGRFDEQDVGAGLCVGLRAPQRLVEPQRGPCVGARDDQEVRRGARIDRDLDLADHVRHRDHPPARRVTALLRELLVLELDRGDAGLLVAPHRAAHVEQPAVAGVRVGDHRRARELGDALDALDHLGVGREPRVRQAERRGDEAESGDVGRVDRVLVQHVGRDQVEDPRGDEASAPGEEGAQRAAGHGRLLACVRPRSGQR